MTQIQKNNTDKKICEHPSKSVLSVFEKFQTFEKENYTSF